MTKRTVATCILLLTAFAGVALYVKHRPEEQPIEELPSGVQTYRYEPLFFAERSSARARHGMVATCQPLASEAALQVLKNGGNAFDAAVTAAAVLSVVEPYMLGPGGDMFAIFWSADEERVAGINASGRAGSLSTREELLARGYEQMPWLGAESINVPGSLRGWADLLEKYGTLSLEEALQPAIKLAEEGFTLSSISAMEWALLASEMPTEAEVNNTFLIEGKRAPREGERFRNPDLAETFKLIARDGVGAFYSGALTERIVTHLSKHNGLLTVEDFNNHHSEWVEPISVAFGKRRVWELPPNGQGVAALEMLRILEPFDLADMGHNSADYLHHLIEAKKLAFADLRYFVGEPEFMEINPQQLLTDEFIAGRRSFINPGYALPASPPDRTLSTKDTSYIAVADQYGNMISMINSLAGGFGTGIVVPGTGFALQNRGFAFTLEPDRANTIGPGRRPFHTLTPGFVTRADDEGKQQPWLAFGLIGGYQQPQGQIQILFNMLLFDMDVQSAIDAGRFRHIDGAYSLFESSIPLSVVRELESMGHRSAPSDKPGVNGFDFGTAQAIMKTDEGYVGGSDPRRDGEALGY